MAYPQYPKTHTLFNWATVLHGLEDQASSRLPPPPFARYFLHFWCPPPPGRRDLGSTCEQKDNPPTLVRANSADLLLLNLLLLLKTQASACARKYQQAHFLSLDGNPTPPFSPIVHPAAALYPFVVVVHVGILHFCFCKGGGGVVAGYGGNDPAAMAVAAAAQW